MELANVSADFRCFSGASYVKILRSTPISKKGETLNGNKKEELHHFYISILNQYYQNVTFTLTKVLTDATD